MAFHGRHFATFVALTLTVFFSTIKLCTAFTLNERYNCAIKQSTRLFASPQKQPEHFGGTGSFLSTLLAASILVTPVQIDFLSLVPQNRYEAELPSFIVPSRASAMTDQQLLVADVWKEVTRQYIDTTYNGLGEEGWKKMRLQAVTKVTGLGPDDTEQVYTTIRKMLKSLDDPYTRFLTPDQYESLANLARGGGRGSVGVQLVVDPSTGYVVVGNVVEDGPAMNAGILPGDVIVEVDGMEMRSATAELVAAKLRGDPGTDVNVFLRHGGENGPETKVTSLTIRRAQLKVNPVRTSTFVSEKGEKIGLLNVPSFNQETAAQVMEGLKATRGCSAVVMDLRGNVGGYMPAGVDVAKLFLEPRQRIITEVDKSGRATIYINDGVGSDTEIPLYVLVDERTASASEILTAALQDNRRATVVGMTKTFGKGRIQNIQQLGDGSGIAVTKAKYVTPSGKDIHKVGITPDREPKVCGPDDSASKCLGEII